MRSLFLTSFVLLLLVGSTGLIIAQDRVPTAPYVGEQMTPAGTARDYRALVQEVFAPITDQLQLTREQEFQIIAIITAADVKADPLVQRFEQVDQQLAEATLIESPDEVTIDRLSAEEARLLTQMIAMKARAKASMFQILTPNQRTLVSRQFLGKSQVDGTLGAISIY